MKLAIASIAIGMLILILLLALPVVEELAKLRAADGKTHTSREVRP
jgi:hypothetical protein